MTLTDRIRGLNYFDGLRSLKTILLEFLATVTSLETNSVVVGKVTANIIAHGAQVGGGQLDGTELDFTIGDKYVIRYLEPGDDYSNVGFISLNTPFIATATTATMASRNSVIFKIKSDLFIIFNDVDVNFTLVYDELVNKYKFNITNNKFLLDKTYPLISKAVLVRADNNNLYIESDLEENDDVYFKIEIYN